MKKLGYKGFTLIELLIVIVIIGILAGVVLQILDPARQQDRAKDGVTRATMNKIALSLGSVHSAYGSYPEANAICLEIENETNCTGGGPEFTVGDASFRYVPSGTPPASFVLYGEMKAMPGYTMVSINEKGVFQKCKGASLSSPTGCSNL